MTYKLEVYIDNGNYHWQLLTKEGVPIPNKICKIPIISDFQDKALGIKAGRQIGIKTLNAQFTGTVDNLQELTLIVAELLHFEDWWK